jgi:hypothetical protein
MLPETPQGFFLKLDLHRLLADLAFQQGNLFGIQLRLRLSAVAGKRQFTFARHSPFQVSSRFGLT